MIVSRACVVALSSLCLGAFGAVFVLCLSRVFEGV